MSPENPMVGKMCFHIEIVLIFRGHVKGEKLVTNYNEPPSKVSRKQREQQTFN